MAGTKIKPPPTPIIEDSIPLYYVYIPAFTKSSKDVRIIPVDNRRYTMKDIGKLEKRIERLGGRQEIPVNVRVVCATNQNLEEMVAEKTFREDLFYRVSEITLNIPPLRDRDEDVIILAQYFLQHYAIEYKRNVKSFSEDALSAIKGHRWPGNIRELQNKVKSSVIMTTGRQVTAFDLGFLDHQDKNFELSLNLRTVREHAESIAIQKAYALTDGNMSKTSELLGVTRPTLYLSLIHISEPTRPY